MFEYKFKCLIFNVQLNDHSGDGGKCHSAKRPFIPKNHIRSVTISNEWID